MAKRQGQWWKVMVKSPLILMFSVQPFWWELGFCQCIFSQSVAHLLLLIAVLLQLAVVDQLNLLISLSGVWSSNCECFILLKYQNIQLLVIATWTQLVKLWEHLFPTSVLMMMMMMNIDTSPQGAFQWQFIYNSNFVVWGRTSACKGAPGSRYQSIFDLTHPTHTLAKGSHNTGNFMPYSFRIVCGFFNVPHWTNKHGRYLRDGTHGL